MVLRIEKKKPKNRSFQLRRLEGLSQKIPKRTPFIFSSKLSRISQSHSTLEISPLKTPKNKDLHSISYSYNSHWSSLLPLPFSQFTRPDILWWQNGMCFLPLYLCIAQQCIKYCHWKLRCMMAATAKFKNFIWLVHSDNVTINSEKIWSRKLVWFKMVEHVVHRERSNCVSLIFFGI